ncbi:hypothetical protein GGQ74_001524 [Desulfobaculum xiamenense]|uniref:TPM domain-containing protein n=1 Tax=Desulfobaculum xiamenense TaxID=995050 RepID=A0A846QRS0_9BACT|nr:TPM domain-containing protein [Desulfobaculum xiamenense]NJB67884.1 hypothetical protein [Desulfobaculum xiamenense]
MRFNMLPPKDESGGMRFLRIMLLICVFVGVGWLYTRHFDRAIEVIQARSALHDATGTLSKEQKKNLLELSRMFEKEFGLELRIKIADGPVEVPVLDSKTIFFGLDVRDKTTTIVMPPLVERALGHEFIAELRDRHMPYHFENDSWPTGLVKALAMTWERLIGLDAKDDK